MCAWASFCNGDVNIRNALVFSLQWFRLRQRPDADLHTRGLRRMPLLY